MAKIRVTHKHLVNEKEKKKMAKVDFSRSVITSTIKIARIDVVNGKIETKELEPIVNIGTTVVKDDKALKLAKAKYKDVPSVVVLGVEVKEEVRGMDFETFMKYSVPVERPASQQKKNDKATAKSVK